MKKIYFLIAALCLTAMSTSASADGRVRASSGVRFDIGVRIGGVHISTGHHGIYPHHQRYYRPYYRYPVAPVVYYSPPLVAYPIAPQPIVATETVYYQQPAVRYVDQPSNEVRVESVNFSSPPANEWWYCHNPDGFYPAIKQCPGGWQRLPKS